jgi:arylformamidase
MPKGWIDISVPVGSGMVHWPNDPEVEIKRLLSIEHGDVCNVSHLSMSVHTGTHMDAPLHFIAGGKSIDQIPLDATIGPARVIEISDKQSIKADDVRRAKPKSGERILFKTRNSSRPWETRPFDEDFVYISQEAARLLAESKVRLVGVDYLSVGGYKKDGVETHLALLGAGIWVIEGLNLRKVKPGVYELICLPLKLAGSDGAPARALLRSTSL